MVHVDKSTKISYLPQDENNLITKQGHAGDKR